MLELDSFVAPRIDARRPLLSLGASKTLEAADLGDVMPDDKASMLAASFHAHWEEQKKRPKPSIGRAIMHTVGCACAMHVRAPRASMGAFV